MSESTQSENNEVPEKKPYKVSSEDINILIKQIPISKDDGYALLNKHQGNIVNCILNFYTENEESNENVNSHS